MQVRDDGKPGTEGSSWERRSDPGYIWREARPRCADQQEVEFERRRGDKEEPQVFAPRMERPAPTWQGGKAASPRLIPHCHWPYHNLLTGLPMTVPGAPHTLTH